MFCLVTVIKDNVYRVKKSTGSVGACGMEECTGAGNPQYICKAGEHNSTEG